MKATANVWYFFIITLTVIMLGRCANPVSPVGGPKDTMRPNIVKSDPELYATNFNAKRATISFDEFIELKNLNSRLLISPPLQEKPDIKIKGKSVVIDLKEELRENTTYSMFFGDAIADITEGNPVSNFEYVFSTGAHVDSLSVHGKVLDAFTLEPEEGVFVMLYLDTQDTIPPDSLPLLKKPLSVARTNKEGLFELNNLKNIPYKIFALRDQNSNYLYDLPNEDIAFSDTLAMPLFYGKRKTWQAADTLQVDSLVRQKMEVETKKLFLFPVIDSTQQITEAKLSNHRELTFILKYPCAEYALTPLNFSSDTIWKLEESNPAKDSITFWILKSVPDTLEVEFVCDANVPDTLQFILEKKAIGKANKKTEEKPALSILSNLNRSILEWNKKLQLHFNYPLSAYDFSGFKLMVDDTIESKPACYFQDSIKRNLVLDFIPFEVNKKYELIIPDSSLYSMYGWTHDSMRIKFSIRPKEAYGKILLNISINKNTPWIIQLLADKGKILSQKTLNQPGTVVFDYLLPGKYKIKAIADTNNNGRWDTGNYLQKLQAEKVFYFKNEIEVRANWELEENWLLQ